MMWRALLISLCLLAAPLAQAHPHVFIDVELRFKADADGQLSAVEVTWTYDDFFSLLLLSERGIGFDPDAGLTEAEQATLEGFDLVDWPEGFDGATFLSRGDASVTLSEPEPMGVALTDGRIVTRHVRGFAPVPPDGLTVMPFDPSYYAALTLVAVDGLPANCAADVTRADTEAADAQAAALGVGTGEALFLEVNVGIFYADRLTVTCD